MYIKKTIFILIIIITILSPFSYADDILEDNELDNYIEVSNELTNTSKEPKINSKHVLALDRKSLTVLFEKDAYSEVAMASTTKIMTCLIALETCDLNETIEFSKEAATVHGSCLEVSTGTKMTVNDILYGLMMRSGNDCAMALAEHISGSVENFANLMNKRAQELNLTHTNFVTPHGLDDENHYTTAYELALLTNYALKNEKFKEIVNTKSTTITINGKPRNIFNTNELLGNLEGVYGVKTGFTFNAGRCLVSACNRNGMDIIVVVLGADTKNQRTRDSIKVINYIYDTFNYVNISNYISQNFKEYKKYYTKNVNVSKTITTPHIKLVELENYNFPLKENTSNKLKSNFYTINNLSTNINANSIIGKMSVYCDNNLLCSLDIILENNLEPNSWYYYFIEILKKFKFSKQVY